MKKLWLLLGLLTFCTSYTLAEVSLQMDGPDTVVVITSDEMEKALFFDDLILPPDDGDTEAVPENKTSEGELLRANGPIPQVPFISSHAGDYATDDSVMSADLQDSFEEIKGKMILDIQTVNWKTGYNITAQDKNFWQRLQYVAGQCSAVASSIPAVSMFTAIAGEENVKKAIDQGTKKLVKKVECIIFDAKEKKELRWTLEGLYFEIITKKPFLLLTLNDTVYAALEETEKEILLANGKTMDDRLLGILVKNMEKFFDLRAKFYMVSNDFRNNTQKLLKISSKGFGDAWSTYKVLADHSLRMNNALAQHTLTDHFEEGTLSSLGRTVAAIGEDAKTNQALVTVLRKDPANKELVKRVDSEYNHLRNRKDEAKKKAVNTTENDKELLLRAYKKK
jgi:hypothetical protein